MAGLSDALKSVLAWTAIWVDIPFIVIAGILVTVTWNLVPRLDYHIVRKLAGTLLNLCGTMFGMFVTGVSIAFTVLPGEAAHALFSGSQQLVAIWLILKAAVFCAIAVLLFGIVMFATSRDDSVSVPEVAPAFVWGLLMFIVSLFIALRLVAMVFNNQQLAG